MAELEAAIARRDNDAAREQLLAVAQQAFDGPGDADLRPTGTGTNGRGRGDDTPHAGSTAAIHQS